MILLGPRSGPSAFDGPSPFDGITWRPRSMCTPPETPLDYEVVKRPPDASDVEVTGCRYAQFYRESGAPKLEVLLVCSSDFPMAEGFGSNIDVTRTQTIMQGPVTCGFRYTRIKGSDAASHEAASSFRLRLTAGIRLAERCTVVSRHPAQGGPICAACAFGPMLPGMAPILLPVQGVQRPAALRDPRRQPPVRPPSSRGSRAVTSFKAPC